MIQLRANVARHRDLAAAAPFAARCCVSTNSASALAMIVGTSAATRAADAVNNHIEAIQDEIAPSLEEALLQTAGRVDGLETGVGRLEGQLSILESRTLPLERALESIDPDADRGMIDRARALLNYAPVYIYAAGILSGIAIVLLVWALIKRLKTKEPR